MEHSEQEQLFGALFGFKTGDRVKTKITRMYGKGWYWRYLTVEAVETSGWYNHIPKGELFYRVHDDYDDQFSYMLPARDLVKVRKYARKKPV